ncbi:hypothetical protein AVEN_91211-1 [Araneus ventricosus]|uniref:Uncharacterized protein n=1 Tax=Araneus ventricosus TaxID=182803 RepID=A0A4Y1ZQI0_ARAVE|nr:hypothetical protein AVEN_259415-1 [Araneus ventricosus]GBN68803.1 hypothetical protein AVEN_91211-1 [Araneus ventricosus]
MTRATPELVPPLKASASHQQEDIWPRRNKCAPNSHARRLFGGIGFRICSPPAQTSTPYHQGTAAQKEQRKRQAEKRDKRKFTVMSSRKPITFENEL